MAGGVIAGLLGLASKAGATSSYIEIDATSVDAVIAYVGNLFTDISPFIWLAIGLPLGFWVIAKTIALVRGRAK
ncbi:unnamed protein product [marine sediment metagenome]|uniref:Uncharacterized protein n=1 Tax=marine sediment metagenome TaxID=412755 RepID=X1NJ72_9ZZZZ